RLRHGRDARVHAALLPAQHGSAHGQGDGRSALERQHRPSRGHRLGTDRYRQISARPRRRPRGENEAGVDAAHARRSAVLREREKGISRGRGPPERPITRDEAHMFLTPLGKRLLRVALAGGMFVACGTFMSADVDPKALVLTLPKDIKWVENTAAGSAQ